MRHPEDFVGIADEICLMILSIEWLTEERDRTLAVRVHRDDHVVGVVAKHTLIFRYSTDSPRFNTERAGRERAPECRFHTSRVPSHWDPGRAIAATLLPSHAE